jgi:endoglucanase
MSASDWRCFFAGQVCSGLRAGRVSVLLGSLALAAPQLGCGGEGTGTRDRYGAPGPAGGGSANPAVPSGWQPPGEVEAGSPVARFGQLRIEGASLVDQSGSPVRLKGVSTMWLNWESAYADSKAGLRWARDNWGLRVVRAAMGVEPTGAYLENPNLMLAQVRNVVHNAIDLGVYVIIDWHDHHGEMHQEQAVEFFSNMAQEFGEYPNVFYEIYNEPMQVDWSSVLKPYHEAVSAAIRQYDPDNIIILGTPTWSQNVDRAANDPVQGTNLMYTVHFYSCTHRAAQRQLAVNAHDRGIPIFVTEWGATTADGGTNPSGQVCVEEAQAWHDFMDSAGISWTAWKLDDCADLSCLFKASAPIDGGWTDEWLNGHGPFVRDHMMME